MGGEVLCFASLSQVFLQPGTLPGHACCENVNASDRTGTMRKGPFGSSVARDNTSAKSLFTSLQIDTDRAAERLETPSWLRSGMPQSLPKNSQIILWGDNILLHVP